MTASSPIRLDEVSTPAELMAFHARHKMDLLSRDPDLSRALGRAAAGTAGATFAKRLAQYAAGWAASRSRPASAGGHVNALQHLAGHIRDRATAREMAHEIEAYRRGEVQLGIVKRSLHARLLAADARWACEQSYLEEGEDAR